MHVSLLVRTNAMPVSIADLNDIPIKYTNGQTVFLKDVGQVHDGWAVQQNIVHNDGQRSVLLSVLKNGNASTVAVVNGVHKVLDLARKSAPPGLSISELIDQSKLAPHRSPACSARARSRPVSPG
jgi:multidrug efflux pump subunit AcrB